MRFLAATLALLLAFAAAQDVPAHCRRPDQPFEGNTEELAAAMNICKDQGDNRCDLERCIVKQLGLLDGDGKLKPQETMDFIMPGDEYKETKEFLVESMTHCMETGEGDGPRVCELGKPLECSANKIMLECGW